MGVWVVSSVWLLHMELFRAFVCKPLHGHQFSHLLDEQLEQNGYILEEAFVKKLLTCFPKRLCRFKFLPAVCKACPCPTLFWQHLVWSVLDISQSNGCGFNLYFPHESWCWASFFFFSFGTSFHVLTGNLYIFFLKMRVLLLMSYKSSLSIWMPVWCVANSFSQAVACLLVP